METIGKILQDARIGREASLSEVNESTKITVQNLAALEADDFGSFPNRVYARAFLRDYANFLGLDSAALLERYEAEWGQGTESKLGVSATSRRFSVGSASLVTIVILAIIAAAVYYGGPASTSKNDPPAPQKQQALEGEPLPKPEPEKVKAVATPELVPAPLPAKTDELKLQVTATGTVWMAVRSDGKLVFQNNMNPGDVKSFPAKKSFEVRTGNAGNAQLHLNGQRLPALGVSGQVAEKIIDRSLLKPPVTPVSPPVVPAETAPAAGQPVNGKPSANSSP